MNYIHFKEAFVKSASENGYDEQFLLAFLKEAETQYNYWEQLITKAAEASGDKDFCKKAYVECVAALVQAQPIEKQANFDISGLLGSLKGPEILGMLKNLGSGVGGLFGSQGGGAGLGGGIVGAGGGMLLGLILSQLFGIPLPTALMLGALGGGAAGYGAAGTQAGQKSIFGVNPPAPTPKVFGDTAGMSYDRGDIPKPAPRSHTEAVGDFGIANNSLTPPRDDSVTNMSYDNGPLKDNPVAAAKLQENAGAAANVVNDPQGSTKVSPPYPPGAHPDQSVTQPVAASPTEVPPDQAGTPGVADTQSGNDQTKPPTPPGAKTYEIANQDLAHAKTVMEQAAEQPPLPGLTPLAPAAAADLGGVARSGFEAPIVSPLGDLHKIKRSY